MRVATVLLSVLFLASLCSGSSGHAVTLTWSAAVVPPGAPPVTGYNVYRSVHGANSFVLLNPAGTLGTAFVDTSVLDNVVYDYYETAQNFVGESVPSNIVSIGVP